MKRLVCALMPLLMLMGCSTVGNVFKKTGQVLMDPSIQVGVDDDQPTQIGLSLYADHDVNPNGQDQVPGLDATDEQDAEDGPYAVRFVSASKPELLENLQLLIEQLRTGADASAFVARPAAGVGAPSERPGAGQSSEQVIVPPLPNTGIAGRQGLELGQYDASGRRYSFASSTARSKLTKPPGTPIAFKVVQLKDDSVLLNADPDQLRKDLKKTLGSTYLAADDYLLLPGQFKFVPFGEVRAGTRFIAAIADFHDANAVAWKQVMAIEPKGRKYSLLVKLSETRVSLRREGRPALPAAPAPAACPVPAAPTKKTAKRPTAKLPAATAVPPLPAGPLPSAPKLPAASNLSRIQVTP
ncbi:type VI secretion system lipoprotein TssJ [Burkholderia contaminans]|uniref:type VI secretion system lipoprotein TssJ n=1 Tax=Burkholderia contaminans TaxID=488447 RepID=UPI000F5682A2|nr:type VI secretion system lipoprotein TssJ [Burkholderia contaminans]ELK6466949.1 type VI secretion system lipoprotein TssJ [Burkholderia contaminans]MCA7884671.1 type VI secretion system lipoprotein TssJ [Burkholderia contaminans]RQT24116.1 type VI secretion system lipoprotein TssJ [Burkholderia contaminans]